MREPLPTDLPIYSDEYASVTGISVVTTEDDGDLVVTILLENYTDAAAMFSMDDVYLNGVECDPYWAASVAPHAKKITTIRWDADDLEEAGLTGTGISSLSFDASIYNNDDWSVPNYLDEHFDLNF